MYVIPPALIVLTALAIFFSPLLAVILFVVFLLGLCTYQFLGRDAEAQRMPTTEAQADEGETGMWSEQRPS
jgi:hypothetical protein